MTSKILLRFLGASVCLAMANCASDESTIHERKNGYSLDNPASKPSPRYGNELASNESTVNPNPSVPEIPDGSTTTPSDLAPDSTPPPLASDPAATAPVTPPVVTPPPAPVQPTYGTPVIGRRGFVYPPGVEAKPENMVDVRDFTPGQKVRDPRTGKIFLVP